MQWFRWYNGTTTDPKIGSIARRCGVTKPLVLAVWAMILESANEGDDDERGRYDLDADGIADNLGCETEDVALILLSMQDRGMIDGERVAQFATRNPPRDDSAERMRRKRQRDAQTGGVTHVTRHGDAAKGHNDALDTEVEKKKKDTPPTPENSAPPTPAGAPARDVQAHARGETPEPGVPPAPRGPGSRGAKAPSMERRQAEGDFEIFWGSYPKARRGAKSEVKAKYLRIVESGGATALDLQDGLNRYNLAGFGGSAYAMGAMKWLNAHKWEVETWEPPSDAPGKANGRPREQSMSEAMDEMIDRGRAYDEAAAARRGEDDGEEP